VPAEGAGKLQLSVLLELSDAQSRTVVVGGEPKRT
jgi:hypothetical protein